MKISRIKTPPRTKGLPDVVQISILKAALAMTEDNPDLPTHVWRRGGEDLSCGYDEGVGRLIDGEPLVATGLWAVAAAAADYARLLGKPHEEKVKATTDLLFRTHRVLYFVSYRTWSVPFVGLGRMRTRKALQMSLTYLVDGN